MAPDSTYTDQVGRPSQSPFPEHHPGLDEAKPVCIDLLRRASRQVSRECGPSTPQRLTAEFGTARPSKQPRPELRWCRVVLHSTDTPPGEEPAQGHPQDQCNVSLWLYRRARRSFHRQFV